MPTGAMKRLFAESSSSSGSGGGREVEPSSAAAAVLCAPRPRRVQVQPCSADLILGPPPFLLSSGNNKKQKEGKSKGRDELFDGDDDGSWALFGGSPPARADNPLVNDPHFLLNQRRHAAVVVVPDSPPDLPIFDHHSHRNLLPPYSSSSSSSFAASFAPAPTVRVQGFNVASCRSSHSNGGGRVLSARA